MAEETAQIVGEIEEEAMAAAAMILEGRGETTIETETKDLLLQITVGVKQGLHLEINHISKTMNFRTIMLIYESSYHLVQNVTLTIVTFEDKAK